VPELFPSQAAVEVPFSNELFRILKMPRRTWSADELEELADEMTSILRAPGGEMRLRPLQALALYELGLHKGLFGPLRVGSGKTLVSLLAPVVLFATRPLLLIPADLAEKTERDRRELSRHWDLPEHSRTMTYDWLGRAQAADALEAYLPDCIITDEAHRVSNLKAAVTRRVRRFMHDHPETIVVVMSGTLTKRSLHDFAHLANWSLPSERSFVPRNYTDLEFWADALDERKGQVKRAEPGALKVLCNEDEMKLWESDPRAAARSAFRRRMIETEGVVASFESGCDATLTINGVSPQVPRVVEEAFETLRDKWATPDGHTFADGLRMRAHALELCMGLFYIWVDEDEAEKCKPLLSSALTQLTKSGASESVIANIVQKISREFEPTTELATLIEILKRSARGDSKCSTAFPLKSTKNFGGDLEGSVGFAGVSQKKNDSQLTTATKLAVYEACFAFPVTEQLRLSGIALSVWLELCGTFRERSRAPLHWMKARKAWHKFCRKILSHSRSLDSESQVRDAHPHQKELLEWQRVQDDFRPNTIAVWLDDFMIDHCAAWAEKNAGIIWVSHVPFGERLARDAHLPYYGRRGRTADGRYIEDHPADRPMIASFDSNHRGKNLQAWCRNLVTAFPANGLQAEQLIGRTHRDGQEADEVRFDVLTSCCEHVGSVWQAVSDCRYVEQTSGSPQKILLAGLNVMSADELAQKMGQPRWDKWWRRAA